MSRPRSARLVLVALAILGLGWWVAPRSAPPLYDGVGFPDQPYRFVVAPSGAPATTKAPSTATRVVPVTKGVAGAASATSAEQGPQISLLIPTGRLRAPAGAKQITLRAAPVQPDTAPSGDYLWSNVYDVSATDPTVTLRDGNPPATITMRAATAQRPDPTIERFSAGTWTKLKTVRAGNDIYQASLPTLGRYAVVGTSALEFNAKSATTYVGVIVTVGAILVVIVLAVLGVRRRRRTASMDDEEIE